MNAQKIRYMTLEDVIIRLEERIMDNNVKNKLNANIKAINRDLIEIAEGKLQKDELIKLQFKAIRSLIDDCERLVTNNK